MRDKFLGTLTMRFTFLAHAQHAWKNILISSRLVAAQKLS